MPYCPVCTVEREDMAVLCPRDGCYYRIERCDACGGEMAPAEVYCIHCGCRPPLRRVESVALTSAPFGRRVLAVLIDVLCVVYVVLALPPLWPGSLLGPLLLADVLLAASFTYSAWGGRRSIGQQILGVATLGRDRALLPPARAAARGITMAAALLGGGWLLLVTWPSRRRLLHDVLADSADFIVT